MELKPFLVVAQIGIGSYLIIYRERIARRFATRNPGARYVDRPRVYLWFGTLMIFVGLLRAFSN